uniref:Uncharacterized protein n=1 Tax=Arundo donax TaxID=35708 RepID=A0A0A9AEN9_ARUDO
MGAVKLCSWQLFLSGAHGQKSENSRHVKKIVSGSDWPDNVQVTSCSRACW